MINQFLELPPIIVGSLAVLLKWYNSCTASLKNGYLSVNKHKRALVNTPELAYLHTVAYAKRSVSPTEHDMVSQSWKIRLLFGLSVIFIRTFLATMSHHSTAKVVLAQVQSMHTGRV